MKKLFIILCLFSLSEIKAQVIQPIQFNNFNEKKMNEAMFDQMNKYVKALHCGDSLIWSPAVQKDVMTDNYNFIKNNDTLPLTQLHNQKWIGRDFNDLPDTIKTKIINEMLKSPNSAFLDSNRYFTYTEILGCISLINDKYSFTYEGLACTLIKAWNDSPSHTININANYKNKVIVGVTSYYNKKRRTLFVSFVHIS
jgi:hypothetical protein